MRRFQPGDRVFMASAGVAVVRDFAARGEGGRPRPMGVRDEPAFYVVEAREVVAVVPFDRAGETLRPLVSDDVAHQMLAVLRGPAPEPGSTKPLVERGRDVVHSGTPLEHARLLRELYALAPPLGEALASGLRFLEKLVLPEVAEVLGIELASLESEMRRAHPAAADAAGRSAVRFGP